MKRRGEKEEGRSENAMKLCEREWEFLQLFFWLSSSFGVYRREEKEKFSSLCGKFLFVVVEFFFHGCEWTRQWREWAKISQNWAVNGDIFTIIQCAGTLHCTIYQNQRGKWTSFSLKSILNLAAFEIFFSPFFLYGTTNLSFDGKLFTTKVHFGLDGRKVWSSRLVLLTQSFVALENARFAPSPKCECGKQPREDGDEWWRSCEIWIIVQSQKVLEFLEFLICIAQFIIRSTKVVVFTS